MEQLSTTNGQSEAPLRTCEQIGEYLVNKYVNNSVKNFEESDSQLIHKVIHKYKCFWCPLNQFILNTKKREITMVEKETEDIICPIQPE